VEPSNGEQIRQFFCFSCEHHTDGVAAESIYGRGFRGTIPDIPFGYDTGVLVTDFNEQKKEN
jgi:hypothetical protein